MAPKDGAFVLASLSTLVLSSFSTDGAAVSSGALSMARGSSSGRSLWLGLIARTAGSCLSEEDFWDCLARRSEWWMQRALRLRSLPIAEGVSLVRTSRAAPRALGGPEDLLSRMMETFSLQISPPAALTDKRVLSKLVEEGRGKLKKLWKPLLLVMTAIKAYLLFSAMAALALIIGKALLVSKIALVLALSALYKKYFGGKKETIEVIKVPHYTQSHHSSEGYHHEEEYSSNSEWEGGSSGGYNYGGDESSSSSGFGGGGYDKRRVDQGRPDQGLPTTAPGADLAYRGYRPEEEVGRWSPREEPGVSWGADQVERGGREERSSPCWGERFRRRRGRCSTEG